MKKNLCLTIYIMICMLSSSMSAQNDDLGIDTRDNVKSLAWLVDLYEVGTDVSGDTVLINTETRIILDNEDYRDSIYPEVYTWSATTRLMSNQELKKAFWYLLNLYVDDDNRDLVIKSILTYNSLFHMDQIMEATYKTYALLDPEIGEYVNGKSLITAPHILEKKLNALKEILFFIEKYDEKTPKIK